MSKQIKRVSLILCAFVSVLAVALGCLAFVPKTNAMAEATLADSLVYELDFSDMSNATVVDTNNKITYTEDAILGKTAINMVGVGKLQSYVQIPTSYINYDTVTFTMWTNNSSSMATWSRPLNVYKDSSNRMEIMPKAQNTSLNVSLLVNGKVNVGNNDSLMYPNATTDKIHPLITDSWVHYAYVFGPNEFSVYANGVLVISHTADKITSSGTKSFSLKALHSETSKILLGATGCNDTTDWTGSIADFRIYNKSLSSQELLEVIGLKATKTTYKDYLVSSYNFNDGTANDSGLGFDGVLVNNAKVELDAERGSKVLVLDGQGTGKNASMMSVDGAMPALLTQATIAMDIKMSSSTGNYTRYFDFAPTWNKQLCLATKWNHGEHTGKTVSSYYNAPSQTFVAIEKETVDASYDKWVNVILTADGTTTKIYIDGVEVASGDQAYSNSIFVGNIKATFGGTYYSSDAGTPCSMDNINIYNKALSAAEVAQYLDDQDTLAVATAKNALTAPEMDCDFALALPATGVEGTTITWASQNTEVLGNDGVFVKAPKEAVTLTATIAKGDASDTKEFSIAPNGVWVEASAKTCTTNGNVAHFDCAGCDKNYAEDLSEIADVVIPASHEYGDLVAEVSKTCTEAGTEAHYVCADCEKLFQDDGDVKVEVLAEDLVIPASHEYGEIIAEVPKTCTEAGTEAHYVCADCEKLFQDDGDVKVEVLAEDLVIPASHDYGELIAEVPTTCVAKGTEAHYVCADCEKLFQDVESAKVEVLAEDLIIDFADHDFGELVPEVPKQCYVDGVKAHKYCADCEKNYDADGVLIDDLTIKAGHEYGEWIPEIAPICKEGVKGHFHCAVCEKDFARDLSIITDLKLDVTHDVSLVQGVLATCEDDGFLPHYACANCDMVWDLNKNELSSVAIPATGHDYIEVKGFSATCLKEGRLDHMHCVNCGDKTDAEGNALETVVISATGHSFGAWSTVTEVTCTSNGVEKRTCACGHSETRAISVAEHNWSDDYVVGVDGHWHICEDCSAATATEAHDYVDGVCECGKNDPAATSDDEGSCSSAVDVSTLTSGFAFMAILAFAGYFVIRKLRISKKA